MAKLQVKKRGNVYQYVFEIAPQDGKRKRITKSEANKEGVKAYNEYIQTGQSFVPSKMFYSEYLDYWMREYFEGNYK